MFRLRDAGQVDLAAVLGWFDEDPVAWGQWTGSDFRQGLDAADAWRDAPLAPGASRIRRFALADADGLAVGYVEAHLGCVPDDAAMLARLVIAPGFRGRGLGTSLLKGVLAELRSGGVGCISLLVARSNEAAVNLYRSVGFRGCLGGGSSDVQFLVANEWKKHD